MIAPQGRVFELLNAYLKESIRHRRAVGALFVFSFPIFLVAPVGTVVYYFGLFVSVVSANMAGLGFYARWRGWDE